MNNDDQIEPKTESTMCIPETTVTSNREDDLAKPLPNDSTAFQPDDAVTDEFIKTTSGSSTSTCPSGYSQYAAQSAVPSTVDKLWNFQSSNPSKLNTEFVIHGPHKEVNCSTSGNTKIDCDIENKPLAEIKEKANEYTNSEYDFIFCIAAVRKTAPNSLKLHAISKIDPNLKVDVKSDGSSLNGYAADHSSSSTNSTMCGHIEDQFLVPKIPRDLFMSFSSSGSSNGPVLHQTKPKSNNILLSKNVYTCPENLVCGKCDHVYQAFSNNLDFKDIQNNSQIKTSVQRSKQKKRIKQANLNNDPDNKKSAKKIKQKAEPIFDDDGAIKIEEKLQNSNKPLDTAENYVHEPISFDIGNKVLAYWVADKLFYPAIITGIVHQKFKVEFLSDCVVKSVNVDGLVHSASLKIGGPIAIFDHISQEFRVGEIVSINEVPNGEETYTIDLDSETVVVPFEKLVLDQEKARMLQDKVVTKNYDRLSKSNISEGKRIRLIRPASVKRSQNNTTKSSKRKIIQENSPQSIKKRKCLFPEEIDLRNVPSTSTGITEGMFFPSPSPASEDSDFDHIREHLTTINLHKLRNTDIDSEHSSPESISLSVEPPKSSGKPLKVFKDLHMVISYAKYKRIPMCNDSDQSTDNELSLKTDYFKPDKPHKKKIEALISKHGGTCHRYLNLIPKSRLKFTYIITDTPSQTCNFHLGLGLGVPCYHHKYIEQAVSQKMPFAEFLSRNNITPIPNGWAIETREIIFRSPNTVHSKIFSGYIIYLALSNIGQSDFFAGLLRFCGAIVYTSWTNGIHMPLTRHDVVIVTDENCPSMLENERVPKLSTAWVIQSLICESVRPIDAHESYIAIHEVEDGSC